MQRTSHATCKTLFILGLGFSAVACNEQAQMGEKSQPRKNTVPSVIPVGFQNSLSVDEFKDRSLSLQASALTLNGPLERAFLIGEKPQQTESYATNEFADACESLALLTGGVSKRELITKLSKQTALALTPGNTNCSELTESSGLGSFQAMNALRFLASEIAADEHIVKDCLSLSKKATNRQSALAWNLSPVTGDGTWLAGKAVNQFDGALEGGANATETAFRSYINIATAHENDPTDIEKIHSSVAAFIDSKNSKTVIKKSEQHQSSTGDQTATQIRISNIEFDFLNGKITESSTYQDLIDTKLVAEWKVSSTVTSNGNALLLEVNAGGDDSEVEFSLDDKDALNCVVN